MVAFAIPNVPHRLLPADGRWHTTAFWRDSIETLIDPATAAAATAGLLTVFDSAWAAAVPDEPHTPHPFEYWYGRGAGIARLVRLGHCLHLLGDLPALLRARLLNSAEFDEAEAEVRAAALFVRLGASITWLSDPTTGHGEFEANWSGHRVPVEVKQLGDGDSDPELGVIDAGFRRGLSDGQRGAATGLAGIAIIERSWASIGGTPAIELVASALSRGRFPSLGAVIMREADHDPEASRTAEVLHVLAGPRWMELPVELREQLPLGSHRVDLLPERARGVARERLDDQDSARASTPAARLAEALQLMRLGYRMRWSRLRREHPSASVEDLQTMMLQWSLGDA